MTLDLCLLPSRHHLLFVDLMASHPLTALDQLDLATEYRELYVAHTVIRTTQPTDCVRPGLLQTCVTEAVHVLAKLIADAVCGPRKLCSPHLRPFPHFERRGFDLFFHIRRVQADLTSCTLPLD